MAEDETAVIELDDEPQDFRFLGTLSSGSQHATIPKRGEKDFEPYGGESQAYTLRATREAMHSALSQPRVHVPKNHVSGMFDVASGMTKVLNPKGQHFRTLGRADSTGSLYLLPEEALYLLERGSLEVRWTIETDDGAVDVPLSLQSGYALLIGAKGLTLEQYSVYANLKRSGYIITRPLENDNGFSSSLGVPQESSLENAATLATRLISRLWSNERPTSFGPLVKPDDVYKQLALVPFDDPAISKAASLNTDLEQGLNIQPSSHPKITFWGWKPTPSFKKSSPGPPDYRVAVLDARETDTLSLMEFNALLDQTPLVPPPQSMKSQLYQRIKHGWRSVIIAVVDNGVVSYVRVADAAFGRETLYRNFGQRKPRGGKMGGRRGR